MAEVHRLSRKITEREPFHLDDLGASNRGGKLGQVVFPLLIELVGKSCEILVCVHTLGPCRGWSFAWVCGIGLGLLLAG